jgi:hypothetical protein
MMSARRFHWTKDETKRERTITVLNSWYFIAGPAEQESGADWRAVEVHPLRPSAFPGALFRPLLQKRNSAGDPVNSLVFRWADGKRGDCAHRQLSASRVGDQCVDNLHSLALRFQSL